VAITRVCSLQFILEGINFVEGKLVLANPLYASHDLDQPALGFQVSLFAKEQSALPSVEYNSFSLYYAIRMMAIRPECGMDLSKIRHPIQPLRRAVGDSGALSSIIPVVKKCFGMMTRSVTAKLPTL